MNIKVVSDLYQHVLNALGRVSTHIFVGCNSIGYLLILFRADEKGLHRFIGQYLCGVSADKETVVEYLNHRFIY
jgi:hypothetical protein